jgi:O-antigen/teichoic acid export membrane protein
MLKTLYLKGKNSEIIKDSFWLLLGSFFLKGSNFFVTILIARLLTLNDLGYYSFIKASATTLTSIVSFFLGISAAKLISQNQLIEGNFKNGLILGNIRILQYLIYFFISFVLIFNWSNINDIVFDGQLGRFEIFLLFLIFILSTDCMLNQSILLGFNKIKPLGLINLKSALISFPLSVLFAYFYNSYIGALIGLNLAFLLESIQKRMLLTKIYLNSDTKIDFSFSKIIIYKILNISAATLLMALISNLSFYVLKLYMLNQKDGMMEIAFFETAYQWFMLLGVITTTITAPVVAKVNAFVRKRELTIYIFKNILLILLINFSFIFLFFIFKGYLPLIYGEGFQGLSEIILIFGASSIFSSLFYLFDKILIGKGYVWLCLVAYLVFSISFLLVPNFIGFSALQISKSILISYIIGFMVISILLFFTLKIPSLEKS